MDIYENMRRDLSIIVVACNIKELIEECLTAIRHSGDTLDKEIIYVDNGSHDGSVAMIREKFSEVIVIESPINMGFGRANNLAYPNTRGKYILMLNADAFIGQDTLQESYDFMEQHSEYGVLGCRLIDRHGIMQPSGRYFPTPWKIFLEKIGRVQHHIPFFQGIDNLKRDHTRVFECDWVTGCYLFVRKQCIYELDFFLNHDFFMYYDDVDLCLRIKRKGWKVCFYPNDVIHLGGANSAELAQVTKQGKQIETYALESEFLYFRKNYNIIYVAADFCLIILFAILKTIKKFLKQQPLKNTWRQVFLSARVLRATHFGKKQLH